MNNNADTLNSKLSVLKTLDNIDDKNSNLEVSPNIFTNRMWFLNFIFFKFTID